MLSPGSCNFAYIYTVAIIWTGLCWAINNGILVLNESLLHLCPQHILYSSSWLCPCLYALSPLSPPHSGHVPILGTSSSSSLLPCHLYYPLVSIVVALASEGGSSGECYIEWAIVLTNSLGWCYVVVLSLYCPHPDTILLIASWMWSSLWPCPCCVIVVVMPLRVWGGMLNELLDLSPCCGILVLLFIGPSSSSSCHGCGCHCGLALVMLWLWSWLLRV